jgi:DNA repair photolyase
MIIKEIFSKNILSRSKVLDYTINPFIGCEHGCTYCYAKFMKRYTRHNEDWGKFVDVKINAADLLIKEIKKKPPGKVWISGVSDPYQPVEEKYKITKRCLEILIKNDWPIIIQTKSPLVLRDLELFKKSNNIDVGLSITTANEKIKEIFEPGLPSIEKRIEVLETLHSSGITTFAMIAPILPKTEGLVAQLRKKVDYILVDKMNYHYANWVYKKFKLEYARYNEFFIQKKFDLEKELKKEGIPYQILFD